MTQTGSHFKPLRRLPVATPSSRGLDRDGPGSYDRLRRSSADEGAHMSPQGQNPDDAARNRDEDLKPGSPPRPATEPEGAEGSARNAKTLTDPATGQPLPGAPKPN